MSVLFDPHETMRPPKDRRIKNALSSSRSSKMKQDELNVFGYSCTLFEDCEKALHYEAEKHLIPWMGDKTLLIDRYDARLYFTEMSQFVSSEENPALSTQEEQIEAMCDEERYLALNVDLQESEEIEDEEMKRFQQAISDPRSAVPYTYEDSTNEQHHGNQHFPSARPWPNMVKTQGPQEQVQEQVHQEQVAPKEVEQEVFVPPEVLQVPAEMELPDTMKQNSIVERTALFVSQHGVQMEIVLKAKQAGNPQFDFLTFDNWLNPYYKHVLSKIKAGAFFPTPPPKVDSPKPEPTEPEDESDEDSDDEGYELHPLLAASLHKKIPKTSSAANHYPANNVHMHSTVPESWASVNTYQIPSYSMVHDLASFAPFTNTSPTPFTGPLSINTLASLLPPPPPPPGEGPEEHDFGNPQLAPPLPPPPLPPVLPLLYPPGTSQGLLPHPVQHVVHQPSPIIPPPPDLQPIVDKLANYVAKNGEEFENIVKAKQDPRFDFLNPWNSHFTYYEHKKALVREGIKKDEMSKPKRRRKFTDEETVTDDNGSKNKPISFSIKAKDSSKPKIEYRSNVIYKIHEQEESDEEEISEEGQDKKNDATDSDKSPKEERKTEENKMEELRQKLDDPEDSWTKVLRERERICKEKEEAERLEQVEAETQRMQDEMIQLERMVIEEEELKAKEKQIQIERRRRAAAFISMLKKTNSTENSSEENSASEPRKRTFQEVKGKIRESEVGAPSADKIKVTEDLMAKVRAAQKNR